MEKSLISLVFSSMLLFCSGAMSATANDLTDNQFSAIEERMSAERFATLLSAMDTTTEPGPARGEDFMTLLATTAGGGQYLVVLFDCSNGDNDFDCAGARFSVALSNQGLTYDDINDFNRTAAIAKAVNVSDRNFVQFHHTSYFHGGVAAENTRYELTLFLSDVQRFMQRMRGPAKNVAQTRNGTAIGNAPGKIDGFALRRPSENKGVIDAILGTAIVNTWGAEFITVDKSKN